MSRLVQVAQQAEDLDRAGACYERLLGQRAVARFDPPGLLFFEVGGVRLPLNRGPVGTEEWMAFIRDSEDNVVRLVSPISPTS
jgi:hypothetical protein